MEKNSTLASVVPLAMFFFIMIPMLKIWWFPLCRTSTRRRLPRESWIEVTEVGRRIEDQVPLQHQGWLLLLLAGHLQPQAQNHKPNIPLSPKCWYDRRKDSLELWTFQARVPASQPPWNPPLTALQCHLEQVLGLQEARPRRGAWSPRALITCHPHLQATPNHLLTATTTNIHNQ